VKRRRNNAISLRSVSPARRATRPDVERAKRLATKVRRCWTEAELEARRKGDPEKVELAWRLRGGSEWVLGPTCPIVWSKDAKMNCVNSYDPFPIMTDPFPIIRSSGSLTPRRRSSIVG
jgi:hypothetical protein